MSFTTSISHLASTEHWLMQDFWTTNGDPRVAHLPFMSSFRIPIAILLLYALFVFVLGPRWMASRKAYSLKHVMFVYNCAVAAFNGYIFAKFMANYRETFTQMFDTRFAPFDDTSQWTMHIIKLAHWYTCSKYVDLLDTVFFILRKKQSQVTALHVYHHFSVAFFGWIILRLNAICNIAIPFAVMNSAIHTAMYGYYALAALGPTMQRYLWWKRYLTQMQIAQFIILFAHSVYFVLTQQGYSRFYQYNYGLQTVIYLVLFTRFYMNTYSQKMHSKGCAKVCKED